MKTFGVENKLIPGAFQQERCSVLEETCLCGQAAAKSGTGTRSHKAASLAGGGRRTQLQGP